MFGNGLASGYNFGAVSSEAFLTSLMSWERGRGFYRLLRTLWGI
jgi:hypothetical protein